MCVLFCCELSYSYSWSVGVVVCFVLNLYVIENGWSCYDVKFVFIGDFMDLLFLEFFEGFN